MEINYHAQPIDNDMRRCVRLERELALGERIGGTNGSRQVPDDADRTTEAVGECAQAIRAWERSLYGQEDNDRRQKHALSNGGQEDLFDVYEDDTGLENMLSNSEQEDLFNVD